MAVYSQTYVKAIVLSIALATIQRMSGAGAIIQFTAKLFKISGSSVEPITASIITGIFQLIGSGVAIFLIDKVGRRKLLLISSAVVVGCLSLLTWYFYVLTKGKPKPNVNYFTVPNNAAHGSCPIQKKKSKKMHGLQ